MNPEGYAPETLALCHQMWAPGLWGGSYACNRRFREAPIFYWLFTGLIVLGASVILLPNFPLVKMSLFSQVINGVLLPVVLIFMVLLVNKERVMKEWVNSRFYNVVAWTAVVIMIGLTAALVAITLRDLGLR